MNEPKPGIKTTEFWMTLLTIFSGAVVTVLTVALSPEQAETVGGYAEQVGDWGKWIGVIVGGVVAAAYSISRGLAKRR